MASSALFLFTLSMAYWMSYLWSYIPAKVSSVIFRIVDYFELELLEYFPKREIHKSRQLVFIFSLYKWAIRWILGGYGELQRHCRNYLFIKTEAAYSMKDALWIERIDDTIYYSKKLSVIYHEKIENLAKSKNKDKDVNSVVKSIILLKKFGEYKNAGDVSLVKEISILASVVNHIGLLRRFELDAISKSHIRFDSSKIEHDELLMRLWTLLMPSKRLTAQKSSDWKLLGFQGTEPDSDFRGMGLLGLEQLAYFSEHHQMIAQTVRRDSAEPFTYPFAIVGITITSLIVKLINERACRSLFYFFSLTRDGNPIHELYCVIFKSFHKEWFKIPNRDIMDFNTFFKGFENNILCLVALEK